MKKLAPVQKVEVVDVDEGSLLALLGKKVILMCMNYHYTGTLEGVNDKFVLLGEDAAICYETGPWNASTWKDAQKVGQKARVFIDKIESYFEGK